ncbi:MAG: DsbA family protein [Haloarculaceae archaeon]
MHASRRRFVAVCGSVALSGCLGGGGGGGNDAVASAPIPSNPGQYTYARMGTGDATVTATYFGSWKCPYCARFSTGFLGDLVSEHVEPGDVALRFRALAYAGGEPFLGPDAPRAARAGLAVWNVDPENYWAFHEHVMANQPPESKRWATVGRLASMAEKAGVSNVDQVRSKITGDAYRDAIRRTTQRAATVGVSGTPMLAVDGQVVNALKEDAVRSLLDRATG